MSQRSAQLRTQDLIIAGAFAALYILVMFASVSLMGMVPILYILVPLIAPIILGSIYMLYVTKIPKPGAILILSAIVGLITSMGGMWFGLIWALIVGVIGELIARAGRYRSKKMYIASYCAFACTNMGPFWAIVLAKPAFLESCVSYYGADYAATIDKLTPNWIIFAMIGMAIVGGLLGGLLGGKLMKKHFEKAGVV